MIGLVVDPNSSIEPVSTPTQATAGPAGESRGVRFRRWFTQVFYWWLLALPAIHLGLISYLSQNDIGIFRDQHETKWLFELIHPSVLVSFTLLSLQGYRLTRSYHFGWLTFFGGVLFCRELHFFGSGPILVGGLLLLLWSAIRHVDERRAFLSQRLAASFFTLSFVSYVVSQLLDRGVFQFSIQLIRNNPHWILLHRSNMEETLETLGGLFLLLTTLCVGNRIRKLAQDSSRPPEAGTLIDHKPLGPAQE